MALAAAPCAQAFDLPAFGPNAPWNIPVETIPLHPESDRYADMLWNNATAKRPGDFNLSFDSYTYPVYFVDEATGMYPVKVKWASNLKGKSIPWNPAWEAAPGSDAQVIILDPATGWEWNLWQVKFNKGRVQCTNGNLVQAGQEHGEGDDPGDFRTKENGFKPSRGCGIQCLAMLVLPEEIEAGAILHALSMPVRKPDKQTCVAPATKLEHASKRSAPGVPEGMRFSLSVTDDEIEDWVDSLPAALSEAARRSARIIAVALRDYGWFITDTSGAAHLQFESRVSAGAQWEALGLGSQILEYKEYPTNLLDGLMTRSRIRAHVPSDQYPRP